MKRTPSGSENRARAQTFLLVLCCCSLVLNGILWRVLKSSKASVVSLQRQSQGPEIGTPVSPFTTLAADGQSVRVDWLGSQATLIYFSSPTCFWCKKNGSSFRSLIPLLHGKCRIYALSPIAEGSLNFFREEGLDAEHTLIRVPSDLDNKLRLQATPDTFVIDAKGNLSARWTGAFSASTRTSIEHYFDLPAGSIPPVQQ